MFGRVCNSIFVSLKGLVCSDPFAVLSNGTCNCIDLTDDTGEGCRYAQPFAFLNYFRIMLESAADSRDSDGEFVFDRINFHGDNERRDRLFSMVEQTKTVLPRLVT